MSHFLAALVLVVFTVIGANEARAETGSDRVAQSGAPPQRARQLTPDFFVGTWATRNVEFGRDVEIFWTLWKDGKLAYRFSIDGIPFDGSTGTWDFDGTFMRERWNRTDGSVGSGYGSVEWIDDDTIRLTIVDNGEPSYTGMSRVYRRTGPPQLSWLLQ